MVAARLLRLRIGDKCRISALHSSRLPATYASVRLSLHSSCALTCDISLDPDGPRCAAEMRSKRTSPLRQMGGVSVATRRVVSSLSAPGLRSDLRVCHSWRCGWIDPLKRASAA